MEYALRLLSCLDYLDYGFCLNPCFNGICSATRRTHNKRAVGQVSILVLMEYALRQTLRCFKSNRGKVSILVLMEYALRQPSC